MPPTSSPSVALEQAFTAETRRGVLFAITARGLYFALQVAIYVLSFFPRGARPSFAHFPPFVIVFALSANIAALALYLFAARSRRPLLWCFVAMAGDMLLVSEFKFGWLWRPAALNHAPFFIGVRYLDIVSLVVIASFYILPLSRRLVLWTGAIAAASWIAGIAYAFLDYGSGRIVTAPFSMDPEALVLDDFLGQLALFGVLIFFLALAVDEGRRFVRTRVAAEADGAFFERFLPPALARRVAQDGSRRIAPVRRRVAVLFLDSPDTQDLALLQQRFSRAEASVFHHGGIIDRFNGGPIMAVFGALDPDSDAARKALACARDLSEFTAALNAGEAICGELGGTCGRVFSVIGDAVNTARRVLDEARVRHAALLATGAFVAELGASDGFEDLGDAGLRGRDAPVRLWGPAP